MYISAGTSECVYTYQEQPLTNLECNPYLNNKLILSCEVQGPLQIAFVIVWYWKPLTSQQPQRLSDISKYDFNVGSTFSGNRRAQRSQLRVQHLNDNDAGWYFCLGNLSNGTLLTPSNRLFLAVQSEYTSALNASTCPDRALSTSVPSCASIASETSNTVSTTTSNRATDGNRGSIDPTSSLPMDHSFLLTSTTVTLAPTPTVTTVPDPESDMLQVALYSVVAVVAVICVIIVTQGFIVILICRKKPDHVKSKTVGKSVFGISPYSLSLQVTFFLPHNLLHHEDVPFSPGTVDL